ncbi:MAG: VWA domain-containing protein [Phycisphaerales bacterium]|nr:VWA domain-containing protein [Phycisphaerales bacterium]
MLAPLAWWRWWSPRRRASVAYSALSTLPNAGSGIALRTRWIVPALRAGAIALVAVGIARPVFSTERTRVLVEGTALQLVVDRSGSMRALDFTVAGRQVDRLDALKAVVRTFVAGGDGMAGRPNDLIGLITFARFADGLSPLTLDHDWTLEALAKTQPVSDRSEDGTAIGEAVALGVERLRDAMRNAPSGDGRNPIRSAAIVLLTDGENNAGDIDPRVAADLAASYGITIYAIGVGTRGTAPYPVGTDPFGRPIIRNVPVTIDEALLTDMAERTGGAYFRATDTDSLRRIYETIDTLEKTTTEQRRLTRHRDLAVSSFTLAGVTWPPVLAAAAALLLLEVLLASTRYRSIQG